MKNVDIDYMVTDMNKELKSNVLCDLKKGVSADLRGYYGTSNSLLNIILSGKADGGYPGGRVVEIISEESVGKTTLAAQAIAEVQKMGGLGVFIDTEHTFDQNRARMLGVDINNNYIYADPEHMEQALGVIEGLLVRMVDKYPNTPIVIVWDSVAGTAAKAEIDGEFDDKHMAPHAKILSQGFRKITKILSDSNAVLICLNQGKESLDRFKPGFATLGGKAVKFHASLRLELRKGQAIKEGETQIGHLIKVKTVKNKIYRPMLNVEIPLLYQSGLSDGHTYFTFLKNTGMITTSGAWSVLKVDGKEHKFYAKDWFNLLEKDPTVLEYCKNAVAEYNPLVQL